MKCDKFSCFLPFPKICSDLASGIVLMRTALQFRPLLTVWAIIKSVQSEPAWLKTCTLLTQQIRKLLFHVFPGDLCLHLQASLRAHHPCTAVLHLSSDIPRGWDLASRIPSQSLRSSSFPVSTGKQGYKVGLGAPACLEMSFLLPCLMEGLTGQNSR